MVRSSISRINKYSAKIVGDVIKNRIDAQKSFMVDQATDRFAELTELETQVNSMLGVWGVTSITKPFYLSFARRLYGLGRKHSGGTLDAEAGISTAAFVSRGLDAYYLQQIASDVFSLDVSASTA